MLRKCEARGRLAATGEAIHIANLRWFQKRASYEFIKWRDPGHRSDLRRESSQPQAPVRAVADRAGSNPVCRRGIIHTLRLSRLDGFSSFTGSANRPRR